MQKVIRGDGPYDTRGGQCDGVSWRAFNAVKSKEAFDGVRMIWRIQG